MKKNIIVISLILFILLMSSCQSTPNESIVAKKAGIEETIQQKTTAQGATYIKYDAPKSWKENFTVDGDFLSINIDAEILIPESSVFPIYIVEPQQISQQQANNIINVLFDGKTLYKPKTIKTKAEIEEEIIKIKAHITDTNSDLYLLKESNPEYYNQAIEDYHKQIKQLEQQLVDAPSEYSPTPIDLNFQDGKTILFKDLPADIFKEIPDVSIIQGEAYMGKENPASIMVVSDSTKTNNKIMYENIDSSSYPIFNIQEANENPKNLLISEKEAIKIAEDALNKMGFSNMALAAIGYDGIRSSDSESRNIYPVLYFTQSFDNKSITFIGNTSSPQTQQYAEPWPDECLLIGVDDKGINRFEWTAPIKVVDTLSESATLLPFEDIIRIFKDQAKVRDVWKDDNSNICKRDIIINKIVLGFAKVPRENAFNQGLLVPAWDFFGYRIDTYTQQEPGGYPLDKNNQYINKAFMNSYISINAIDGSIVDRVILK